MEKNDKIFIAGHKGLVGSAIYDQLINQGYKNLVVKTRQQLDLTNSNAVCSFFESERPDYVFLAAAKVGGIIANNIYRADFILENLRIQNNVIQESFKNNVKKLLFLGSTCIYPKESPQPMKEEYLLTAPLEYTNEPYAIAKIAGIKLCESFNIQYGTNFISVMPTNLYGFRDNFDLEKSHVLPALMRKMHLAKLCHENNHEAVMNNLGVSKENEMNHILKKYGISSSAVEIWGSGKPMREFLWNEDLAEACVFIMDKINFTDLIENKKEIRNTHINIGTQKEISIYELAQKIKKVVGYKGDLFFNKSKPDGTLRKLTDSSKLHNLGWKHKTSLDQGLEKLYQWYQTHY